MKKNSLTIILIVIIFILVGYIIYDKFVDKEVTAKKEDEKVTLLDNINLPYVDIYLTSDGLAYLEPLNKEQINKLNVGDNLKSRLTTLYDRSFYFDIYLNNNKLKGFKVQLDDDITKIRKVEIDDYIYIIFIKDNYTIGLFNYDEYYNLLYTKVEDNYNNLENIKDIKNNKIIYLDGSKKNFEVK